MSSDFLQLVKELIGLLLFLDPRTLRLKCTLHLGCQTCLSFLVVQGKAGKTLPLFVQQIALGPAVRLCLWISVIKACSERAPSASGLGGNTSWCCPTWDCLCALLLWKYVDMVQDLEKFPVSTQLWDLSLFTLQWRWRLLSVPSSVTSCRHGSSQEKGWLPTN